ncbi:MAG: hypothetical protein K0R48_274 [Gammaproteobacteria bacterium]|nr:hypothetical protein [Gammaproteobacteria bacterium]
MAQNNALFNTDDNDQEIVQERLDEFFSSVMGLLHSNPAQPKRNAKEMVEMRRQVEEILIKKQTRELYEDTLLEMEIS